MRNSREYDSGLANGNRKLCFYIKRITVRFRRATRIQGIDDVTDKIKQRNLGMRYPHDFAIPYWFQSLVGMCRRVRVMHTPACKKGHLHMPSRFAFLSNRQLLRDRVELTYRAAATLEKRPLYTLLPHQSFELQIPISSFARHSFRRRKQAIKAWVILHKENLCSVVDS